MERIDFEIVSVEKEIPQKVFEAYIAIHEDLLEYKVDYFGDYQDEDTVWHYGILNYFNEFAQKSAVHGVSIQYLWRTERWKVVIVVDAFADDFYVIFNDEKKAKSLFKKIMAWKFPNYSQK